MLGSIVLIIFWFVVFMQLKNFCMGQISKNVANVQREYNKKYNKKKHTSRKANMK